MVPRMYTIGLFCLCDLYLHRYLHTCAWVWGVGVERRVCTSTDIGAIYNVAAAAYGMSCFIGDVSYTAAAGYGMPCVNGWDWLHRLSGLMHC